MFAKGNQAETALEIELETLTADLPTLIALPVVLRGHCATIHTVADMLGVSEDEYRKGCLLGFSRAEECAAAVGQRILGILNKETPSLGVKAVVKWLEAELATADE
jgi:hypothetical protein